ncbi:hypothetical protein BDN72DRAFT_191631 [Pluteus cervinus]|uniref:Uncharacterized protein n=1 Tax=Pluteus cervinus TaxID=181527 RepID=A0ACD3AIR6_9AGAR|nr:hypothetical protein BDN72DRAFT_191631 [Pluteus cervinus]
MADDGQAMPMVPVAFSTVGGDRLWHRLDWWKEWCLRSVQPRRSASHSLSNTSRADDHSAVAIICKESLSLLRPGGRHRRGHFSGPVEILTTKRPNFLHHRLHQNLPLLCFVDLMSTAKRPLVYCIDRAQFSGFPPWYLQILSAILREEGFEFAQSLYLYDHIRPDAFAPPVDLSSPRLARRRTRHSKAQNTPHVLSSCQ